jgi:fructokinase
MRSLAPSSSSSPENDDGIYLAAVEGGGTTFVVSVARVLRDDEICRDDDDSVLRIGPTRLRLLETATVPPRDGITGHIPNWTPSRIIEGTCDFLNRCRLSYVPDGGRYSSVGIATFGPCGVDPTSSDTYGRILMGCPKREWRGVDLLNSIARACGILPMSSSDSGGGRGGGGGGRTGTTWVGFDTDVNAPALAEFRHRTHASRQSRSLFVDDGMGREVEKPLTSLSYVTVGTGVGVGLIMNSMPVHGLLHPEGGHVTIRPLDGDDYAGYAWGAERSPYGGKFTVEGTTSSVALTERYHRTMATEGDGDGSNVVDDAQSREVLSTLPDDHPLWDHASNAIANLCVTILLLTSCQRIVLGGGVMKRNSLYGRVRLRVWTILNRYLDCVYELSDEGKLDDIIVGGSWGDVGSGLVGAYALALDAYEDGMNATVDGRRKRGGATGGKEVGSTGASRDDGRDEIVSNDDDECRSSFARGVLAGIGLSLGCALATSALGRGVLHRR